MADKAIAAFKHNIRNEWLARELRQEKPQSTAALTLNALILRSRRQLASSEE